MTAVRPFHFLVLFLLLACSACEHAGPPAASSGEVSLQPLGPSVPDAEAVLAGRSAANAHRATRRESLHPVCDPLVQTAGDRLAAVFPAAASPWRFILLSDPTPLVFATPDGQVIVHTGYCHGKQGDALAAGIAREMAHVLLRHPGQRMYALQRRGVNDYALYQPYTSTQRRQAEALAKQYLARAGFNPASADALYRAHP